MTDRVVEDLPPRPDPAAVRWDTFVSYRHTDRTRAEALAQSLAARDLVVFFDERGIQLGADWDDVIGAALDGTRSCLVLVGPTGVGGVQAAEVQHALARQAADPDFPIVAVLLPGAKVDGFFADYLHERSHLAVGEATTDDDLERIANAIRGLGLEVPTGPPRPNPYPGLRPFDSANARHFFGREREVADLAARAAGASMVSVVGPSGTGKSSVLLAGLLPALADAGGHEVVVVRPGDRPRHAVTVALGASGAPGLAAAVRTRAGRAGPGSRFVLAVDQLEEVVTRTRDADERGWLLDGLTELAAAPGGPLVVVTVRSDHLGALNEHPTFGAALARSTYLLGPLDEAGVRDAIRRPAWDQRVGLQDGLVAEMIEDLRGQPNALPLLAVTLAEMWDHRRGDRLTMEAYQAVGRVGGALSQRAEAVVAGVPERVVDLTLGRLVDIGPNGAPTRRRRRRDELVVDDVSAAAGMDALLGDLAAARLVVADDDAGTPTYELAHDALLTSWARLAGLVRDRREALALRGRLSDATADWLRAGRHEDAALRGESLTTLDAAVRRGDVTPTADERALLALSRAVARRGRRRVAMVAGLAAFTVVAVVAALVVNGRSRQNARERDDARRELTGATADRAKAQAERAAAEADRDLARAARTEADAALADAEAARAAAADAEAEARTDRDAATAVLNGSRAAGIRQALAASAQRATPVTRQAVAAAATRSPQPLRIRPLGETDRAAYDPSGAGRSFVVARPDGRLERCAAAEPAGCVEVLAPTNAKTRVNQVAVGDDGRPALLASDGAVESTGGWRAPVDGASVLALTPAGDALVVGTTDGRVELHRADGAPPRTLASGLRPVRLLAVDPTGSSVAVVDRGSPGVLVVPTGETGPPPVRVGTGLVEAVLLTERYLVAADGDTRDLVVWSRAALDPAGDPGRLSGHPARVVAMHARGDVLVSGDATGVVRRWDLERRLPLGAVLPADAAPSGRSEGNGVRAVGFTTDRTAIVVLHLDGTANVWPADDHPVALDRARPGAAAAVVATARGWLAVTPDALVSDLGERVALAAGAPIVGAAPVGEAVAVARVDGVELVDRATGSVTARWATAERVTTMATGGGAVVVGGGAGTVTVLDGALAGRATVRAADGRAVAVVAVSADGSQVAFALAGAADVRLVPAAGGAEVTLGGHGGAVASLAFSADGRRLASGADDRVVLVRALGGTPADPQRLVGHTDKVTGLAFVTGTDLLASGSEDGGLRLWTGDGIQLGEALTTGADRVVSLVAWPGGPAVSAVAAGDVVTVETGGWTTRLCDVVGPAPAGTPDPCR